MFIVSGSISPVSRSRQAADAPCLISPPFVSLLEKQQGRRVVTMTHANRIAPPDLSRCHQIRQWLHEQPLDSPFQMARAVPRVRAFMQQELPGAVGDVEVEGPPADGGVDALLYGPEFDIDDSVEFFAAQ